MGLERMIFFFKAGLFLHPQWSAFTLTSELTAADERPARSSYLSRFPHYPSTANNGKIASQTDNVSGEQVLYTYDAVNRLLTATATSYAWGQSYGYDGFGNLTDQNVTYGSAPSYSASPDPATNHVTSTDANSNATSVTISGTGQPASDGLTLTVRCVSLEKSLSAIRS